MHHISYKQTDHTLSTLTKTLTRVLLRMIRLFFSAAWLTWLTLAHNLCRPCIQHKQAVLWTKSLCLRQSRLLIIFLDFHCSYFKFMVIGKLQNYKTTKLQNQIIYFCFERVNYYYCKRVCINCQCSGSSVVTLAFKIETNKQKKVQWLEVSTWT